MSDFPSLTGRKLIVALSRLGFEVIRVKGSHYYLRHEDGRSTVVPVHRGETIGAGLLAKGRRMGEPGTIEAPLGTIAKSLEP